MILFNFMATTKIKGLPKGYIKSTNEYDGLICRDGKIPVFYVDFKNYKFYELENVNEYEREQIDNFYKGFILENLDDLDIITKELIKLLMDNDKLDYRAILSINTFKDGEVMMA